MPVYYDVMRCYLRIVDVDTRGTCYFLYKTEPGRVGTLHPLEFTILGFRFSSPVRRLDQLQGSGGLGEH
jgi:hypothetical protein